ncbi:uncharacterized protein B0T23DRAFT_65081 [Neurospora hispaniola]|uniref:Phosphoribosylaminoimidazole-succinocarboxamide synthase n=1 Tax=Neurospora hispaniola TaxID=588809 RepID=A0AAJ0ICI9_9PEZI|nr:hypothetical protein B0T23DRAFT_65081 [Neurospora hispaniola]
MNFDNPDANYAEELDSPRGPPDPQYLTADPRPPSNRSGGTFGHPEERRVGSSALNSDSSFTSRPAYSAAAAAAQPTPSVSHPPSTIPPSEFDRSSAENNNTSEQQVDSGATDHRRHGHGTGAPTTAGGTSRDHLAHASPIVIQGPPRVLPDLPPLPPPTIRLQQQQLLQQQPQKMQRNPYQPLPGGLPVNGGLAAAAAGPVQDFKDDLAREAGVVTPGVDDTPYVQYAIEALTRGNRESGYSGDGSSGSEWGAGGGGGGGLGLGTLPVGYVPAQHQQQERHQPREGESTEPSSTLDPALKQRFEEDRRLLQTPFQPKNPAVSADSLASTLLKNGPRPAQPHEWRPLDRDALIAKVGEPRANGLPTLDFLPMPLTARSLVAFMLMCLFMAAALIFSAVWSHMQNGLTGYVSIYGSSYFLFRILPQFLGGLLLLWAQFIIITAFRILPFVHLASPNIRERDGALFEDMYPRSFLWPPQFIGGWKVWVPILATWVFGMTLPLLSSLFTVVFVDDVWMWATVQGVAWTAVALYLVMFISTVILWRYFATLRSTGLAWDPRSLADIIAIVSETNTADEYRGTQLASNRGRIRFALRHQANVRLGYWTWKDGRSGVWYTLGSPMDQGFIAVPLPDQLTGKGMTKFQEKQGLMAAININPVAGSNSGSGTGTGMGTGTGTGEDYDMEAVSDGTPSPQGRYRYLPWCLRTSPLLLLLTGAFILLLALFIVSFLPATRITKGFLPGLPAAPVQGAFSAANFLYSFLPSLLGLSLYLLFQTIDMHLRILQPWAAMSSSNSKGGASADASLLADYAACGPVTATFHALKNGHWRMAFTSACSTLFILLPVLGGGMFMALTQPAGSLVDDHDVPTREEQVLMFPNFPAFAIVLALCVLYFLALLSLLPARKPFRFPHGVTCLAEIISYLANEDLLGDLAFKHCRSREELKEKLGVGRGVPETRPRWTFGLGYGGSTGVAGEETLGVRRARRFTVRKSQIKFGGLDQPFLS